jgi:DNA polymerase-3 subunit alpha
MRSTTPIALATRCNVELSWALLALPAFPVPSEHTIEAGCASRARGSTARLEKAPLAPARPRGLRRAPGTELDVIIKMGFPGYFLIVARLHQLGQGPRHPGRSGPRFGRRLAGRLGAGITDLDPLRYDLLFERFLNPERVSMPDFDIDFCMDRRDEVIDYVARKYGRDRVSQIITYGTMAAKAVVRDSGRVLGHPYGFVDGIAKLIPTRWASAGRCAGRIGSGQEGQQPRLGRADRALPRRRRRARPARPGAQLEDLTRNAGKHAGGVVIAPSRAHDLLPAVRRTRWQGRAAQNPVTQFDKDDVEGVGLVKFDFLGLRTLTIIDWAVKAINARRAREGEAPLDITALPLDDKPTYELFARGDTVAVFQFESRGMRDCSSARARHVRRHHRARRAVPPRPARLGDGSRLGRSQARQCRKSPTRIRCWNRCCADLRRHRVPGTGDADRAGAGGLYARRRRPAAPRDGQEEARGDGEGARQVRGRRRERRHPRAGAARSST